MRLPSEGKSLAIGEYALGCLQGAQTFTGKEKGLHLSQIKRGRYWGHPDLIGLLTRAGENFYRLNRSLIVGDLSQSRGGPTLTGHNSHQTGLDVDIWFKMPERQDELDFRLLETEDMQPIKELDDDQIKMIKYFANDSSVERIFINASFKRALCVGKKLSFEEHQKLRPWWGHDDHIHVRLKCPADSPACVSQNPLPPADGCGPELDWWFTTEAKPSAVIMNWEELKGVYLKKVKTLPEACSFYSSDF
jgi:penicillin-insensitive murein endopeptidase